MLTVKSASRSCYPRQDRMMPERRLQRAITRHLTAEPFLIRCRRLESSATSDSHGTPTRTTRSRSPSFSLRSSRTVVSRCSRSWVRGVCKPGLPLDPYIGFRGSQSEFRSLVIVQLPFYSFFFLLFAAPLI